MRPESAGQTYVVQGILFYYPHEGGEESVPRSKISEIKVKTEFGESEELDTFETEDASDHFSMTVFWAERLIPSSEVRSLPFFPALLTKLRCEKSNLPANWKQRIRGFLFFDASFPHISNNKIRLLTDLDTFLNNQDVAKDLLYKPKNIQDNFLGWLQYCHKTFDKEYLFSIRNLAAENAQNVLRSTLDKRSLFDRLTFDVPENGQRHIVRGDVIKIWVTAKGQASKAEPQKANCWLVSLVGFQTSEELPTDQVCNKNSQFVDYLSTYYTGTIIYNVYESI